MVSRNWRLVCFINYLHRSLSWFTLSYATAEDLAKAQTADIEAYTLAVVHESIRDQYHIIDSLERFLKEPRLFDKQDIVPLDKKNVDELLLK